MSLNLARSLVAGFEPDLFVLQTASSPTTTHCSWESPSLNLARLQKVRYELACHHSVRAGVLLYINSSFSYSLHSLYNMYYMLCF